MWDLKVAVQAGGLCIFLAGVIRKADEKRCPPTKGPRAILTPWQGEPGDRRAFPERPSPPGRLADPERTRREADL